jgi:VacB/RNase II family 3'-5' exoribonuclease
MKRPSTVDLKAIAGVAMEKYGFRSRFPAPLLDEIKKLRNQAHTNGNGAYRDLRSLLWSSIDNIDSMDLDQLEYAERGQGDEIRIRVAVADVDTYVPKGSQADQYAAHNGTSVYTGIVTYPMLPDRLSKDITSLLPDQDRLALVAEYSVLADGSYRPGDVYRALVRNKAKLVYEQVGEWLEGTGPVPALVREVPGLAEQLHLQNETARRMRKDRMDLGALDLETIEPQPLIEGESVKDLILQRQNMARKIIEEFMIGANRTMVTFLGSAGIPMIQRVVRVPKFWDEIVLTAAGYGEQLPGEPDVKALAVFLKKQKEADPLRFPDLSLTVIKLLGPGEYMTLEPGTPPTGHFSMAVTDYTHGTAPNRRYVDLINQRLQKSVLDQRQSQYTTEDLTGLSSWLSDREKESKKVERFMRKAAAAVLLQNRIGDSFEAIVTGASAKGTYVRLFTPPAEGRIMRGEHGLRVGQKVIVRLLKTDPFNGFLDFECTGKKKE